MNSMRNTDLYEHNPVNNDALPRANTQPHPGKRQSKIRTRLTIFHLLKATQI